MSKRLRIASLFRQLADAFDDLEKEEVKKPRRKLRAVPSETAQLEVLEQVQSTLRKQGIRT